MFNLFIEGGFLWMATLTIEFIGLFLAAWKAPAWTKEIGLIALITGFIGTLVGIYQMSGIIHELNGEISSGIIFGGLKVALITLIYGCFIYGVSLVIRIIQKPRLG